LIFLVAVACARPEILLNCHSASSRLPLSRAACNSSFEATAISPSLSAVGGSRHSVIPLLPMASARTRYDDGGFSVGNMERPALQRLLADIRVGRIDIVVVYKVDRLTRSLADFARLVEIFDAEDVSFVSVTQQFNTTSSMGRLTLNVLLSFAQFEREVTGERIRDKIAA
jgi:hypothetical protein